MDKNEFVEVVNLEVVYARVLYGGLKITPTDSIANSANTNGINNGVSRMIRSDLV
jgi:hypothetical protein